MTDVVCSRCGHHNSMGARFCSSCGAAIAGPDESNTTMTFEMSVETDADEAPVERNDLPPGVGCLVAKRGPNAGSRFALDKDVVTAGRHPDSDIFLDDITVSRRHVEVARRGDGYIVRDVGSLNGTYVNRQRVEEAELHEGDEVQIGTFKLVFLDGSD